MKRSPLTRSKPLRRQVGVRRRNPRRLKRLRAKQFGPQAALCRTLPCCVCKARPLSDPHHVKSRGAGGDDSHCVPLCRTCHRLFHDHGASLFVANGVRIDEVLADLRMRVVDEADDLPVSVMLGRPSS